MINYKKIKSKSVAIYLNFPFCKSPCIYCHYIDNIKFGYNNIPLKYFEVLYIQLENILKKLCIKKLDSIYFGGGTPSLLNDQQIKKIELLLKKYNIKATEVSIEIYPNMCNFDYVNNKFFTRYSIGVQSFSIERLKKYKRNHYTIEDIIKLVKDIRSGNNHKDINIDIIFSKNISDLDIFYVNKIKPETATFYPNTKDKGLDRLRNVIKTLDHIKNNLIDYSTLGKSKYIFIKKDCSQSKYAETQYEKNGDIIGIGHNSISYINDKTFLCLYSDENEIIIKNRKSNELRFLTSILMGINTGVRKKTVLDYMYNMYNKHFLLSIDSEVDIIDKHINIRDNDLVYLPENEYIRFYRYIRSVYNEKYANIFLKTIGYGDNDFNVINQVYNNEHVFYSENEYKVVKKIKTPNLKILIEGIDGSGKDTFARIFSNELKKRFMYASNSKISILGQPDSKCENGIGAKKFIEDLDYIGNASSIASILSSNRLSSEEKISKLDGIIILVRGLVTDIATFNNEFGYITHLGENVNIKEWDKYIVIDVEPEVANLRIEKRGIPRTWREEINYLDYFRKYYLNYENSLFKEKIIIKNDSLNNLENKAKQLAEEIYNEYK